MGTDQSPGRPADPVVPCAAMPGASVNDPSENTDDVVAILKLATRDDHLAGGTLHLFPELWEPGDFPDTPEREEKPDA